MKFVYMNHRIRQKKPTKPVIVCQDGPRTVESNRFAIESGGRIIGYITFDPKGLDACDTHEVKAWVELDDDVLVYPVPARGAASVKLPNQPVKL